MEYSEMFMYSKETNNHYFGTAKKLILAPVKNSANPRWNSYSFVMLNQIYGFKRTAIW